jgi:phage baseplate assembly protein W
MAALYKGFSSYEFERVKEFAISDVELVKLDLLNHIYTRRGSRVMMPTFGTVIPELVFEPLDAITTEILEDELRKVFDFDPRVEIVRFELLVNEDANRVDVQVELFYVELDIVDDFELNIVFEE